ncbi:T9SS type A sorting domain-containing protein [Mesonia aquimarina]|uniref:T9SS type A sorting domain-containing protein n=1 Tax=Mesonia aquimarina TaxID=1504967 RepID=UPI000EF5A50B|nr:T9SS type A sorting domain-containing protein [Mesonia aquimarina]
MCFYNSSRFCIFRGKSTKKSLNASKIIFIILLCVSCCLNAQTTSIPDANFEQALIDKGIDSDNTINGMVLTSDISGVTSLNLSTDYVDKITGIEDFTSLKVLNLSDSGIHYVNEPLDLSSLQNLEELYINSGGDHITLSVYEIVLTNNPNLELIYAYDNWYLRQIDLKGSDVNIDELELHIQKYGEAFDDEICIQVTNANDAQNLQGDYVNWTVTGGHNFSENCNLSVDKFSEESVKIYPNPVQGYVTIQAQSNLQKASLYSLQGKKTASFSAEELKKEIDLSPINSGVYLLRIVDENGAILTIKLIKK